MSNTKPTLSPEALKTPVPEWFLKALATPSSDRIIEVDGCPIHYVAWGVPGRRGIVFVHGGGAHAHWWTHIAAQYAADYRVAALDMSGHGDSGRRGSYSLEGWTDEVMAVAGDADMSGKPVIVGHSMGGFVTILTAAKHSDDLAGVVICDSPLTEPDPEIDAARVGAAFGQPKVYENPEQALARFRTVPPQDHYLDYVMAELGPRSLGKVDGGWSGKFDHRFEYTVGRLGSFGATKTPWLNRRSADHRQSKRIRRTGIARG